MALLLSVDILQNRLVGNIESGKVVRLSEVFHQDVIVRTKFFDSHNFNPESIISEFLSIARKDKKHYYLGGKVFHKICGKELLILPFIKYKKLE